MKLFHSLFIIVFCATTSAMAGPISSEVCHAQQTQQQNSLEKWKSLKKEKVNHLLQVARNAYVTDSIIKQMKLLSGCPSSAEIISDLKVLIIPFEKFLEKGAKLENDNVGVVLQVMLDTINDLKSFEQSEKLYYHTPCGQTAYTLDSGN